MLQYIYKDLLPMTGFHILIAPNAFKNSLTAQLAAKAIEKGFQQSELVCTTECFPIGDGGDGTGGLLIEKNDGQLIDLFVTDPLGRKVAASYGLIDNGKTAVIEMAQASGIRLLQAEELDPLRATSFGTGQIMLDAVSKGVSKILIAMGGSATVDGGAGILAAVGAKFLDEKGAILHTIESFTALKAVDSSMVDPRVLACEIVILCDVDNRLLGDAGAAAMFGPQKGAGKAEVIKLETSLTRFAEVVNRATGQRIDKLAYGGAAGGAAAGLYALLNAKLVNGAESFLHFTGFEKSLSVANLVITGEGSIDEQTLQGKAPYAVAVMAKGKRIKVVGFAGKIPFEASEKLSGWFDELLLINDSQTDLATALKTTAQNLERTAFKLGNLLAANRTA